MKQFQGDRGKCSPLALRESGQIVNLSAPIGEVARSAEGEVSRRDKKFEFCHSIKSYVLGRNAQPTLCHPELDSGSKKQMLKQVQHDKNKKAAFTLAEVLITIGIIGVVSAMTIPNLIQKNQKRIIEANIKEDYSIIQQVIRQNEANDIDIVSEFKDLDTQFLKTWFETYFAPYMKYNRICYDTAGCWQDRGPNKALSGVSVAYDYGAKGIGDSIITVKLNNGSNLNFNVWGGENWKRFGVRNSKPLTIFIDANGDSPPNVFGKDIYVMVYTAETGLVYAGYHKTDSEINQNCSKNATGNYAGFWCLMRIKNHGWQILDEVWKIKT